MMLNTGMVSSNTDEWATPQALFDDLNNEFQFDVDVCADDWNHKCAKYFTKADDGLQQEWLGSVWMNPPYGRAIKAWMAKAVESWKAGASVVCLVPARTDTAWWHDYAMQGEIRFLRGRVKFVSRDEPGGSAPFPSAVVIFRQGDFEGCVCGGR
jgi:phage N-6-adenine-methyltransferase